MKIPVETRYRLLFHHYGRAFLVAIISILVGAAFLFPLAFAGRLQGIPQLEIAGRVAYALFGGFALWQILVTSPAAYVKALKEERQRLESNP